MSSSAWQLHLLVPRRHEPLAARWDGIGSAQYGPGYDHAVDRDESVLGGGRAFGSAVRVSNLCAAGRRSLKARLEALLVVLGLPMPAGRARLSQPADDQTLCLCN